MIISMIICDNGGFPFYDRRINENGGEKIDPTLLSGLISAIGTIGKSLFNEEIATISFGTGGHLSNITTVTKELFGTDRVIYFVFITKGDIDKKRLKQLCTTIFIEAKSTLKDPQANIGIHDKIDRLIDFKYNGLKDY